LVRKDTCKVSGVSTFNYFSNSWEGEMHVRVKDCMGKQTVWNYNCQFFISGTMLRVVTHRRPKPDRKGDNIQNYVKNQIQFDDCMVSSQEGILFHLM